MAGQSDEKGACFHVIKVSDTGIGFDSVHCEKIFQLFTRLHGNNTSSGYGVGLCIVKKIIENHQGLIHAESSVGEGSTFVICLPLR